MAFTFLSRVIFNIKQCIGIFLLTPPLGWSEKESTLHTVGLFTIGHPTSVYLYTKYNGIYFYVHLYTAFYFHVHLYQHIAVHQIHFPLIYKFISVPRGFYFWPMFTNLDVFIFAYICYFCVYWKGLFGSLIGSFNHLVQPPVNSYIYIYLYTYIHIDTYA